MTQLSKRYLFGLLLLLVGGMSHSVAPVPPQLVPANTYEIPWLFGLSFATEGQWNKDGDLLVALTFHNDIAPQNFYIQHSWNRDGTLSVWGPGYISGLESRYGAIGHIVKDKTNLSLCYSIPSNQNQPSPAVMTQFVVEFRIRGLRPGRYTVKEVSRCE
jgi:hypothetical protein